jgi:hypothetical protein
MKLTTYRLEGVAMRVDSEKVVGEDGKPIEGRKLSVLDPNEGTVYEVPMTVEDAKTIGNALMSPNVDIASPADLSALNGNRQQGRNP